MKRTIFGLLFGAVALVGGGCHDCPSPGAIVYWTFTDAAGQHPTTDCATAGVTSIRILLDGTPQTDANGNPYLSCATYGQGAMFYVGVAGPVNLKVEAFDANGGLLYVQDTKPVNFAECGNTVVDATLASVQASFSLDLTGFSACPNPGYLWYSLTDLTTNQRVDLVDGLHNPTSLVCSGTVALFDYLPPGPYRLDFVQVVTVVSNAYVASYQNCTPMQFTHSGNDAVTVNLAPATTTCAVQ